MTATDPAERQRRARAARRARKDLPPVAVSRLLDPTPFWFQFASCRPEHADRPLDQWVDLFFPTRGAPCQEAKAICSECPAQAACADYGIHEHQGIWGGSTERQRRARRRERRLNTPA